MQVHMCKSKIHRVTVTDSNLNYIGSITIDEDLMKAANLYEFEQVHVVNINNGARFVTYVIRGESGNRSICVNGAASRLVEKGDILIIISYASINEHELNNFKPCIVHVDHNNRIVNEIDSVESQLKAQNAVAKGYLESVST